ncbi:MAG: M15 family metallopeptidase [Clostridia bacterium]|nr:M15 family metallopeptidase [Clostridia bacterium]
MAFLLALGCCAYAEEEVEFTLEDVVELEEVPVYGDVDWTFPVDLKDMDPVFIRLANKTCLLSKEDKPDPIMTMVARKANKDGSNANGGVNKASGSKMQLQETCGLALVEMFEAALEDGVKLYLKSAYRSYQTQNTMYYNRLKKNNGKDDGWVSKPGASDHQTGLGCDIVSRSWRDKAMNSNFAKTDEAQWMKENAFRFGFILRYPSDKEEITEINFEPWHYRYVGIPVATYIMENGMCLEEFHQELQKAIDEFIAAGGNPAIVEPFIQRSAQ